MLGDLDLPERPYSGRRQQHQRADGHEEDTADLNDPGIGASKQLDRQRSRRDEDHVERDRNERQRAKGQQS